LRSDINTQLYATATGAFYGLTTSHYPQSLFYYVPNSYSVTDNADVDKTISFSAQFDNDVRPWNSYGTFFDFNVSVDTDNITDRAMVNIEGELKARGTFNNRWAAISGYYFNTIANSSMGTTGYLYQNANFWYTGVNYNMLYGSTAWELNPNYESLSPGLPVHHQLPEFTQTRVH